MTYLKNLPHVPAWPDRAAELRAVAAAKRHPGDISWVKSVSAAEIRERDLRENNT